MLRRRLPHTAVPVLEVLNPNGGHGNIGRLLALLFAHGVKLTDGVCPLHLLLSRG